MDKILNSLAGFMMVIIIALIIGLLLSWPLQLIWNDLFTNLFGLRRITVGEAFELSIFFNLLLSKPSNSKKD